MRKISELSTDEALDVLCELTPLITSIVSDDDLMDELKKKIKKGEGEELTVAEMLRLGIEKVNNIIPIVLKKNRDALLSVVAVMAGCGLEEIKAQNFLKTGMQIRDLAKDKDLMDFVKSCLNTEKSES